MLAQAEFGGWLDTPHLDYVAVSIEYFTSRSLLK